MGRQIARGVEKRGLAPSRCEISRENERPRGARPPFSTRCQERDIANMIEQKSTSEPVVKVLKLKTEKFRVDDVPAAAELELLARLMDSVFYIPGLGIRFGLDALIGLVPGLGDLATSLVSLYILKAS